MLTEQRLTSLRELRPINKVIWTSQVISTHCPLDTIVGRSLCHFGKAVKNFENLVEESPDVCFFPISGLEHTGLVGLFAILVHLDHLLIELVA